jgi:hypothetical protein
LIWSPVPRAAARNKKHRAASSTDELAARHALNKICVSPAGFYKSGSGFRFIFRLRAIFAATRIMNMRYLATGTQLFPRAANFHAMVAHHVILHDQDVTESALAPG